MHGRYDAIVIGSGLGGLTAGALFTHAGYRVLVLEQNARFGGAATTYHRGALTIEASLHETTDPRKTVDPKGEIFEALGLYEDVEFVPVGDFYEVRCPLIGEPLTIPHGVEALCGRLTERFPAESESIRRFLQQVDSIGRATQFLNEKHDGSWWLSHGAELPFRLWSVFRDMGSTLSNVLERYFGENEAIKFALAANLPYYSDDPDQMWWLAYAVAQGGFFHGGGNYIKGGSQVLSDRLVEQIRRGGGGALAEQTVVEILLGKQGEVAGARYRPRGGGEDTVVDAPVVFANAAPHAVQHMLPEGERDEFMAPYHSRPLSTSLFSISLGVDRRPSELGLSTYSTLLIPAWMNRLSDFKRCAPLLADMPRDRVPALGVVDYSRIESGLTDGGPFPLNVVGVDRFGNWEGLSEGVYRAKKGAWLDAIIERLEQEWPGIAKAVVHKDIATARTMREYLNTPEGAIYGFAPNVPERLPLSGPPRKPKTSVRGLWLASAYAGFGGFSGAMGAGAAAAKAALRDFAW